MDMDNIWGSIEPCPAHPHALDPDEECDGCKGEVLARSAVLEQMQAEANNRMRGLAQNGIPFPPFALDMIKVQIMWENVFQGRDAFMAEGELGRRALAMIKDMQSQNTGLVNANGSPLRVVKDKE